VSSKFGHVRWVLQEIIISVNTVIVHSQVELRLAELCLRHPLLVFHYVDTLVHLLVLLWCYGSLLAAAAVGH